MTHTHLFSIILTAGLLAYPINVQAGEARFGLMRHDIDVPGIGGKKNKELSVAITTEYIFDTDWMWGAKPYVYVSGNLEGKTNHTGVGLNFRRDFKYNDFYVEWGGGLSVHDGSIRVPNPIDAASDLEGASGAEIAAEVAARFARKSNEIEYGSRMLFRNQLVAGYHISDVWGAELTYEHLSNGTFIGGPENEGVDNIGVRATRRF